jgi:hypothetical protein
MRELPQGSLSQSDRRSGGRPRWKVDVFTTQPGGIDRFWLLNRDFLWIDMHWSLMCHVPCLRHLGVCEPCRLNRPWKPMLWISCQETSSHKVGVLSITHHMWQTEYKFRRHTNLRGLEVTVKKTGMAPNSRRYISIDGQHAHPDTLPAALDVDRFVRQIFAGEVIDGKPQQSEVKP